MNSFRAAIKATYFTINGELISLDRENWEVIAGNGESISTHEVVLASKTVTGRGVWKTFDQANAIMLSGELKPAAQHRADELGLGSIDARRDDKNRMAFIEGEVLRVE